MRICTKYSFLRHPALVAGLGSNGDRSSGTRDDPLDGRIVICAPPHSGRWRLQARKWYGMNDLQHVLPMKSLGQWTENADGMDSEVYRLGLTKSPPCFSPHVERFPSYRKPRDGPGKFDVSRRLSPGHTRVCRPSLRSCDLHSISYVARLLVFTLQIVFG